MRENLTSMRLLVFVQRFMMYL